jgi:alpha-glucosidase (family GH31 glycosyl hydrolase)
MAGFYRLVLIFTISMAIIPTIKGQKAYQHEEKKGLVSLETEHFAANQGWKEKFYYTGNSVFPDASNDGELLSLEYSIRFNQTGNYRIYVLGNRDRKAMEAADNIMVSLQSGDQPVSKTISIELSDIYAPRWHGVDGPPAEVSVVSPGDHILRIQVTGDTRLFIDKIVLHNDPGFRPEGIGPAETLLGLDPEDPVEIIIPPAWAFGVLYGAYTNQEETRGAIDRIIDGDFPIDAYWIDSYFWDFDKGKGPKGYIDFVGDTTAFPDMQKMWDYMEEKSIKSGIWVWNLINQEGNEDLFREFNKNRHFRDIYTNRNGWHNADRYTITGVIDFERKETVELWKKSMKPFFDKGLDFLKLDNSADYNFARAAFTACQEFGKETRGRAMILAHLSATNDERFKLFPARWTGDAKITWTQPDYPNLDIYAMGGLKENVQMVADPYRSTYAIPFLTNDVGGYDYFGSEDQSDELYMRWVQFASFNTLMTVFSTAKNPTRNHPYGYSEEAQENFRKYTHLRMRLFPYFYTGALQTRLTGKKMISGDGIHTTQFLVGNHILVAPVVEKGATERNVYFPKGAWYDFETGAIYTGDKNLTVPAPIGKLPWFVREGTILPMRKYARSIESGTNDLLEIHLFPAAKQTEYTLLEDDGSSEDYRNGRFSQSRFVLGKKGRVTLFEIEATRGTFTGMAEDRDYELVIHGQKKPDTVTINGRKIPKNKSGISLLEEAQWSWDRKTKQLSVAFKGDKRSSHRLEIQ